MLKPLDDLQKFYKVGEILNFNAVQAPINSRAKWKATRVWKCTENTTNEDKLSTVTPATKDNADNGESNPAQVRLRN